ncbi:MAG: ATP-binding protein, partial [Bacteroidaceae bacterium]|nr:ATP-binding protein [Bacteroidaceae bacterium]
MDKGFNLWVRGYDNEGYEDAYNRFLELAKKHGLSGADSYRRLAGEVEARNVQSRMYLSDEMRRRSHASQTEDVPRDEQIVIYRDGAAEAEEKSRSSERGRAQSQTATSSENLNQTGTDAEYKSAVESGDMEEGAAYGRESDKSRNALSGKINNGASEFNSEEKAIFASDKELQKEWIDKNIEELVKSYDNGNVFDPDEIRKLLSPIGYDGNDVASYKDAQEILNNAILDKMLADAVASGNPTVTLLSGLPGSGKSFAARKFADNLNLGGRGLVVDKPFNSYDSIVELYEKAKEKGIDDINIVAIYCDPVRNVKNIISRGKRQGRWTPIEYWLMNFKKQSDKLKRLSEEYPDIKLTAIENTADGESIFYDDATKAHDWKFELTDEQKDEIINFIQQDYEIDRTFAKEAIRAINETRTRTNNEIVSGPVDGGGRTHDIRGDSGQVRNAERVTAARKPYGAPVTEQKKIEPSENIMADTSDTSAVRNAKNALAENKRKGEDVTNKPQAVRDAEQTVVNYFKEQIDKKWMDAMSKLKLNRMLSIFPHLNAKNQV